MTEPREAPTLREVLELKRELLEVEGRIKDSIHSLWRHVDTCTQAQHEVANAAKKEAQKSFLISQNAHSRINSWQVWAIGIMTGVIGAGIAAGWKVWVTVQELIHLIEKGG